MKFLKNLAAAFLGTFIALGMCFILIFSIFGAMLPSGDPYVEIKPSSILTIDLADTFGEQSTEEPFDLSSLIPTGFVSTTPDQIGILDAVKAIDMAATDPNIEFIYIKGCEYSSGIAYLEEVRAALDRFRKGGKAIIAYGENFSLGGYYLASVSDKVYSDVMASNNIVGVSTTILYLKDILERLGVKMQLIRHGKYKSAGEQFIANDISEANREQNLSMINSLWNTIAQDICTSRNISVEALNDAVDNLNISTPEEMLEAGLIDEAVTYNEMVNILCELTGAKEEKDINRISLGDYAKAKVTSDFKAKDKIAIIYADGEIKNTGEGLTSEEFVPIIRKVRKDSTIKAVVLRVNSPGGGVQAAESIRQELEILQAEKPIIVSYGTMAASGGYWISAGCDKIFTNKTTLTGSIGVFSMIPSAEKTFKEKLHINPVTISSHPHADMYNLTRDMDKVEIEAAQKQVDLIYGQFLEVVSEGRGITPENVDRIAQGRVWTGEEAMDINLVNEFGGLNEALEYAAVAADLTSYRLVEYPRPENSVDKFMKSIQKAQSMTEAFSSPEKAIEYLFSSVETQGGIYARMPVIYLFN